MDEIIKKVISEKLEKIDELDDGINYGPDSNFASTKSIPNISNKKLVEIFKTDYHEYYIEIQERIDKYLEKINNYFYKEMFDSLYIKLKELYDEKYQKYIKVNEEYYSNIKENEFAMENDDKMEEIEKMQIQNIIDCLKEEQKDQIDQILDECNKKINNLKDNYKWDLFENIGAQLIDEQLKLNIYTMINNAFY